MSSSSTDAKPTILYVADPRADVVLRSSDEIDFPVRRVSLEANSEVFDGMFSSASRAAGQKDEKTGLPLIKLEEKALVLDPLLRTICRGQVKLDLAKITAYDVAPLWEAADKFGAEMVEELAVAHLRSLAASSTLQVLSLSLIHEHLSLTKYTLPRLSRDFISSLRLQYDHKGVTQEKRRVVTGSLLSLADLPIETFRRVPAETIQKLLMMEREVIFNDKSWTSQANQFTFN